MLQRLIKKAVVASLFRGKIVIVYGPRQSGKTTLVKDILKDFESTKRVTYYSCDDKSVRDALSDEDFGSLTRAIGAYDLVVLDEAQRVKNIGLKLKLLVDQNPEMQIIATGSASFDLANKIAEPLTGRFYAFELLPLATKEIVSMSSGTIDLQKELTRSMVYGNYPDIYSRSETEARTLLSTLSSSYLYKDILELENIRKSDTLEKIVTLLALQIGNEVNVTEIARTVRLNVRTVESYINLLEKAYVLFRLRAYSTNSRTEVSRNFKVYFYDCGVRNSIIQNFNSLEARADVGGLFENWCIVERMKVYFNAGTPMPRRYFWRSYTKQEVDYLEQQNAVLTGFEFKYDKDQIPRYKNLCAALGLSSITLINQRSIDTFLTIS
jgi:predicted AAA+ superfamily ATPase